MNDAKLKKQIREINKRIADGETVEVTLEGKKQSAHLAIDAEGARRLKRKPRSTENQPEGGANEVLGIDAPATGETFRLDLDAAGDISDAQIAEKIEQAVALSQTAGVTGDTGDLPRVVLTRDEARRVWVLFEKCSYQTAGHTVTALAGYETDLASIPRIFWSILAPEELSLAAPLFHDLIYRCGGSLPEDGLNPFDGKVFERKDVDDLFLELMRKAKIPRWKRTASRRHKSFSLLGGGRILDSRNAILAGTSAANNSMGDSRQKIARSP